MEIDILKFFGDYGFALGTAVVLMFFMLKFLTEISRSFMLVRSEFEDYLKNQNAEFIELMQKFSDILERLTYIIDDIHENFKKN